MRIFVAGATGALGRRLVPLLVAGGHDVVGLARSERRAGLVRELGATAVVADALDAGALEQAVAEARPDVVVHQLTALAGGMDARNVDRSFAATNRIRTEGTDNLLAAARAAGAGRFVAQSFAGWPYAREGGPVKSEEDPLDEHPPANARETVAAIRHLERAVLGAEWVTAVVLRYGAFYGPGTSLDAAPDAEIAALVRRRRFPVVGDGGGVWSLVHIDDAASATVAAIERGGAGIYNVVDDEPAPVSEWLPALASALGAKAPLRVPRWLGRLAAGEAATVMMTEARGASNEKLKRELGWEPAFASWREGFERGLG